MNYNDDNRNALTPPSVNTSASTSMVPRNGAQPTQYQGGYPAGYPAAYARYPALEVEKNSLREYWRVIKRHKWRS